MQIFDAIKQEQIPQLLSTVVSRFAMHKMKVGGTIATHFSKNSKIAEGTCELKLSNGARLWVTDNNSSIFTEGNGPDGVCFSINSLGEIDKEKLNSGNRRICVDDFDLFCKVIKTVSEIPSIPVELDPSECF